MAFEHYNRDEKKVNQVGEISHAHAQVKERLAAKRAPITS
jgi:hypothetical protein